MAPSINVKILGDESSLLRAFRRSTAGAIGFERSMGRASRGALAGSGALGGLGRSVAFASGTFLGGAGLAAAIGSTLTKTAQFERSMNVLQAVTGATGGQMRKAGLVAQQLGGDITLPGTSAKDAAEAMTELAKGNLSVNQAMAAARGTLQLAAAGQISVSDAAVTTARALNAFGLSGDRAVEVADVLANAANSSTGEISDFAEGLSQSSASAHQAGLSIQDTTTALAELANKGIVGSDAGTSFKTMLGKLVPQTALAAQTMSKLGIGYRDVNGNLIPLRDQIAQYSRVLATLNPVQRQQAIQAIFGSDAQRAANIVLGGGVKAYDKMHASIARQGSAARISAALNKGLLGAFDGLKSAIETVQIQLGTKLAPVLTKYLTIASSWLSKTRNQQAIMRTLTSVAHAVTGAFHALQSVFQGLNTVTGSTRNTLKILLGVLIALKGLKVASSFATIGRNLGLIGTRAGPAGAAGKVGLLTRNLRALSGIGAISIGIELLITNRGKIADELDKIGLGFLGPGTRKGLIDLIPGAKKGLAGVFGFGGGDKQVQAPVNPAIDPNLQGPVRPSAFPDIANLLAGKDAASADRAAALAAKTRTDSAAKVAAKDTAARRKAVQIVVDAAAKSAKAEREAAAKLVERRNTFFDTAISRSLNRVQDIPGLTGQINALKAIGAKITARMAVTRDVTRKLNLEDQLIDIVRQQRDLRAQKAANDQAAAEAAKQKRADQAAAFLDSLQFGLEKAQATVGFGDDLKALAAIEKELRARIKAEGSTTDLQRQLFDVAQQRVDIGRQIKDKAKEDRDARAEKRRADAEKRKDALAKAAAARSARGFRALGLTATGEAITPGVTNLRKRLGTISSAVQGTFLDTSKTEGTLARIRKALTDALAPQDVRSKVKEMLDGINDELKNHAGEQTKFAHVSSANFVKSLNLKNLTREQKRAIQAGFTQIGAGNTAPRRTGQFALAGGGGIHVTMHNPQFHGVQDIRELENQLDKRARSRPQVRRGAR